MRDTIPHDRQRRGRRAGRRSGAAFLMLVVLVLLVVVGATKTFLVGEVSARRGESNRLHDRSLAAAIEATRGLFDASTTSLTLPIDEASSERIEVRLDVESSLITAHWMSGDRIVEQMVRPRDADDGVNP